MSAKPFFVPLKLTFMLELDQAVLEPGPFGTSDLRTGPRCVM